MPSFSPLLQFFFFIHLIGARFWKMSSLENFTCCPRRYANNTEMNGTLVWIDQNPKPFVFLASRWSEQNKSARFSINRIDLFRWFRYNVRCGNDKINSLLCVSMNFDFLFLCLPENERIIYWRSDRIINLNREQTTQQQQQRTFLSCVNSTDRMCWWHSQRLLPRRSEMPKK